MKPSETRAQSLRLRRVRDQAREKGMKSVNEKNGHIYLVS